MKQITTRMRRGMPIPAVMLQSLIDNDRSRTRKIASRPGLTPSSFPLRFLVYILRSQKRIYIGVGTVATTPSSEDHIIRPMMPTLNGDPLDAEERPYFDYSGYDPGEHEIVCAFNNERAQIQVWKDGEIVDGQAGGSGEEEDNDAEQSLLIATVNFSDEGGELTPMDLDQRWASDIAWELADDSSSSGSSGSDESGSSGSEESQPSDGSEEPSDGGSDKSTAVVPAYWTKGGYTALFCMEMPEVRFHDVLHTGLRSRVTRLKLDPRFVAVCEPGSIVVLSMTPEQPMRLGAKVEGGFITITRSIWSGPCQTAVYVSGIRKGFAGVRFPNRDRAEFEANERFHKMAKPKR